MSTQQLSDAEMAVYRSAAAARQRERARARLEHRERALALARRGADLLRTAFAAQRVAAFGSLVVSPERFDIHSDVDLVAWGLDERDYYRAVAQLLALDPCIAVDLVCYEAASPSLQARIDREAVAL